MDAPRPAPATVVEGRPGVGPVNVMLHAIDRHHARRWSRHILDRVLEEPLVPRHDDAERLVTLGSLRDDVDHDAVAVRLDPRSAVHLVNRDA